MKKTGKGLVFYVSPQGNDRWSGNLPEPAADLSDGPFATLERARDALRGLKKPARVQVRGGTYLLAAPLTFTPRDSGTQQSPVVFEAFPGEHPVVSGGQRVGSWSEGTVNGRPCWTASLPEVAAGKWNFTQLFVDGVRRPRTRLPKEGYYRFAGVPDAGPDADRTKGPDAAFFAETDIQFWRNLDDVRLVALHLWIDTQHRIRAVDPEQRLVSFRAPSMRSLLDEKIPGAYARYYVENVFEALDTPGQWYLDRAAGLLYYLPLPGESPETTEVIAPKLDCVLLIQGTRRAPAQHIRFENISFQHAEWDYPPDDVGSAQAAFKVPGAVILDHAGNCVLYGCEVTHVAQYGVEMRTGCSGNRLVACSIHDMGAGGVRIGHEWLDRVDITNLRATRPRKGAKPMAALVTDCRIHDGSMLHPSAIGIWIGNSGRNRILRNHIFNLNYTGISCGWTWGYAPSATRDNRIEDNHIHHINWNRILSDNGGIYTLGIQPGTVLRGNYIHHVGCYGYGGWGIYPDEGSSEMLIENNVVHDTDGAGFSTHYGRDNVIRNNVFARSGRDHINPGRVERHRTTVFGQNIVAWRQGGFGSKEWRPNHFRFRGNLFWNGGGPLDFGGGSSLADWQAVGQHLDTIIADPLFTDPEAGDFSLRADSPVFQLGFRSPDVSQTGPRRCVRRPVSFGAWPVEREAPRAILRTRIERAGTRRIRVTVENTGDAPASGRLALQVTPRESAWLDRPAAFAFRALKPGARASAEFPITIAEGAEQFVVESIPAGGNLFPAAQFFVLREPEWRIPRIAPVSSPEAVWAALAAQASRALRTPLGRTVAEYRAAAAGEYLALSIGVVETDAHRAADVRKNIWGGSVIELFINRTQTYLVPASDGLPAEGAYQDVWDTRPAPGIKAASRPVPGGYEIAALVPMALVKIDPAARTFALESALFTAPVQGLGRVRFQLFEARSPVQETTGCATVIVK